MGTPEGRIAKPWKSAPEPQDFSKARRTKGIQETIDMSAEPNLAVKNVKFEAALRAYMLPGVDVLTKAEKPSAATELEMVEGMQFERGYN
jgi:hypothetical protein